MTTFLPAALRPAGDGPVGLFLGVVVTTDAGSTRAHWGEMARIPAS